MVQELLKAGTVQASSSPYASPVVLVKKKDNTWRPFSYTVDRRFDGRARRFTCVLKD